VGLTKSRHFSSLIFLISFAGILEAAPQLRLTSSTVGPVSVATGSAAATQTVEAYNIGSGSLNLSLSSSVTWISPTVGAQRNCTTTRAAATCLPINLALNTQALPAGQSTGIITVSDPNAVDAPQTITVTVAVGGNVPSSHTFYVAPGSTADYSIVTNNALQRNSNASWLTLGVNGGGSFTFIYPYSIHVDSTGLGAGTYNGNLTLSGSSFAPDNKTVAVTMNVTNSPIAKPFSDAINLQLALGAPPLAPPFSPAVGLSNAGLGNLNAQTPVITTSSCGSSWITYGAGGLTFDTTGLSAGVCKANIALASDAANGTQTVPVTLTVVPKGPPVINYQGVLDNATFVPGDTVSPGDVMVVKGDQLSLSAYTPGSAPPLSTQVADTSVLVNNTPAPIFYTSYGQIAFQLPTNTPSGQALVQVKRTDGTLSNTVSVNVVSRAPKVLLLSGTYGAIVNNDSCRGTSPCVLGGSLPLPASFSAPGYPAYPARAGDVLTIYAIGLGATSPAVSSGQPSPTAEPFARLTSTPTVDFGAGIFPVQVTPSFAALTPGYAGLYQINVTVPPDAPKGIVQMLVGFPDGTVSNQFQIAIQ
jgi:uncharacterized protein (TIGR03437 family)